jgi:hypothetical protein
LLELKCLLSRLEERMPHRVYLSPLLLRRCVIYLYALIRGAKAISIMNKDLICLSKLLQLLCQDLICLIMLHYLARKRIAAKFALLLCISVIFGGFEA